ncbi:MAG: Wzz/FepE/Etk N-terminal domain-containing protein [Cyclobacteriaceae bacterium]
MNQQNINHDDNIDLIKILMDLWRMRRSIFYSTVIFSVIGMLIGLGIRPEYKASCKLLIEDVGNSKNPLGKLGGLAGLAGINFSVGASNAVSSRLYPQIITSLPFQRKLLEAPIFFSDIDSTITSKVYLMNFIRPDALEVIKRYTIGLPGRLMALVRGVGNWEKTDTSKFVISKRELILVEKFRKRFEVIFDDQTNIVSFTCQMPDPHASAYLTETLVDYLTAEITSFKIEKARQNLNFIQEQHIVAEKKYLAEQQLLADFIDGNRNINTNAFKVELQHLHNNANVSLEVYRSLAGQLEQAKYNVNEKTPVFTIIEPTIIPVDKDSPNRLFIILVSGAIGASIVILASYLRTLITKIDWTV